MTCKEILDGLPLGTLSFSTVGSCSQRKWLRNNLTQRRGVRRERRERSNGIEGRRVANSASLSFLCVSASCFSFFQQPDSRLCIRAIRTIRVIRVQECWSRPDDRGDRRDQPEFVHLDGVSPVSALKSSMKCGWS